MYTGYLHVSVFTILSRFPHQKKSICISKKPAQGKCLKYVREIISVNKTKYFKPKLGSKFCLHLPKPPAAFYLLFSLHFNYRYVPLNDWPVLHSRAVFRFMAFLFLMRICGLDLPLITQQTAFAPKLISPRCYYSLQHFQSYSWLISLISKNKSPDRYPSYSLHLRYKQKVLFDLIPQQHEFHLNIEFQMNFTEFQMNIVLFSLKFNS